MYGTCLFCNTSLGANEVVETFPVGRRLAFDARRGRLWVVCRRCERWNLSPLEERWEAVEDLERMFRETRIRASTENVGLARHREGLELVRIGQPLRPEFAAWRYGDQFGRRRRRAILYGVGGIGVFAAITLGGAAAGLISSGILAQSGSFMNVWVNGRTRLKLRTDAGDVLRLKNPDLLGTRIRPADDDIGFAIELRRRKKKYWFEGEEARRVAGLVLPKMNAAGGRKDTVLDAVRQIDLHHHPDAFLRTIAQGNVFTDKKGVPGYVNKMPKATKLAVEMALHEESERRALEGELWRLEQEWKSAEEIASIADELLVTEEARRRLAGHPDPDVESE